MAGVLARSGDAAVIAEAKLRFERYLKQPSSVSPSMIGFVLNAAGRNADAATLDALIARAQATESTEERNRLTNALTRVDDPVQAARVLQLALSAQLPPQITTRIVPAVAGNDHIGQAWQFAVEHREALMKNQDAVGRDRAFASIVANSTDPLDAERMEAYVKQQFGDDALREAQRVGNGVRIRAALKARLLPQVHAALQ
jgi:aminopeptidase N